MPAFLSFPSFDAHHLQHNTNNSRMKPHSPSKEKKFSKVRTKNTCPLKLQWRGWGGRRKKSWKNIFFKL